MEEETHDKRELESIYAVMELDDELQALKRENEEVQTFVEKVDAKARAPKKTIRKRIKTAPAYQAVKSRLQENFLLLREQTRRTETLYNEILCVKDTRDFDKISQAARAVTSEVKAAYKSTQEVYKALRKALSPAEMVSLEENPRDLPFNKNLARVKYSTSENFVTKQGLLLRRLFLRVMQSSLKSASRRKTVVEEYHPELLEGKTPEEADRTGTLVKVEKVTNLHDDAYIFVPNHLFDEEFNSMSLSLDRTVFYLIGSTNQIEHNPLLNFLWLSGLIYVDRQDPESRKDSVRKMEKLLNKKISVVEYIEGRYNNTENKLTEEMFYSAYELWERTGKKVVPIATHTTMDADTVYVCFGKPLDFTGLNKYEARDLVREKISEMHYEQIRQHSIPLTREYLDSRKDYHFDYMIQRRQEYCHHPWYDDVWEEELTGFIRKDVTSPEEVRASFDKVKITPGNAFIFAPILLQREQDKKYDFKQFMKDTYDKDIRALYPDNDILDYEYQKESGKSKKKGASDR